MPFAMAETPGSNKNDNATIVSSVVKNSEDITVGIQSIHYYVTASVLNVRQGPGTSYPIVGQVYEGDTVWYDSALPDTSSSWTPIYKGSLEGYVSSQYITEY